MKSLATPINCISLRDNAKDLKEVDALLKLNHERIVSIQDAWIEDPPPGWQVSSVLTKLSISFSLKEQADCMMFSNLGISESCINELVSENLFF